MLHDTLTPTGPPPCLALLCPDGLRAVYRVVSYASWIIKRCPQARLETSLTIPYNNKHENGYSFCIRDAILDGNDNDQALPRKAAKSTETDYARLPNQMTVLTLENSTRISEAILLVGSSTRNS